MRKAMTVNLLALSQAIKRQNKAQDNKRVKAKKVRAKQAGQSLAARNQVPLLRAREVVILTAGPLANCSRARSAPCASQRTACEPDSWAAPITPKPRLCVSYAQQAK
jgi:hypothetical protein